MFHDVHITRVAQGEDDLCFCITTAKLTCFSRLTVPDNAALIAFEMQDNGREIIHGLTFIQALFVAEFLSKEPGGESWKIEVLPAGYVA